MKRTHQNRLLRRTLWVGIVGLGVCLAVSCGNEVTRVNPGTADSAGDNGSQTDGTPTLDTTAPDTKNQKNVACEGASEDTGKGYAFTSFSYTPETPKSTGVTYDFDCTLCPGGKSMVYGTYKYYENDILSEPDPKDYRESITFDGNFFTNVLEGIDSGTGEYVEAVATGFYFCPDPKELKGIKYPDYWNTVFVYLDVQPYGAFGIQPGVADICFLGNSLNPLEASGDIYIECNFFWDPNGSSQGQNQYCKIGKQVIGQECPDPFAN